MIDDNQKRFIPHLAIDNDFFHSEFVKPKAQSERCAHLPIECIIGNYCTRWRHCFKGLSLDGGHADFLKSLRDASFNKDLSNDPTFGHIHLAGQYL